MVEADCPTTKEVPRALDLLCYIPGMALWSNPMASMDPVVHTAGRDIRSGRLNNCSQGNQSPETTVQLAKLRVVGGASGAL